MTFCVVVFLAFEMFFISKILIKENISFPTKRGESIKECYNSVHFIHEEKLKICRRSAWKKKDETRIELVKIISHYQYVLYNILKILSYFFFSFPLLLLFFLVFSLGFFFLYSEVHQMVKVFLFIS